MVLLLLMLPMCQKSTGRSHTTHDKTMISKPRFFPFFLHHLVMITDYSQNDETFYEIWFKVELEHIVSKINILSKIQEISSKNQF